MTPCNVVDLDIHHYENDRLPHEEYVVQIHLVYIHIEWTNRLTHNPLMWKIW